MTHNDQSVHIRPATADDSVELAALMEDLGYPGAVSDIETRYERLWHNPDYQTYLAICDGETVGMIGLNRIYRFEHNEAAVRIGALVVRQGFRNRGIGAKLMLKAEEWAGQKGADMLYLNSGNREERVDAHRFYQDLGFEPYSTGFKKRINP
jgi:GNAT superfamily N-acetyltransferase